MPKNIIQFQVVASSEPGANHIIYALDDQGVIWLHNPTLANGRAWNRAD